MDKGSTDESLLLNAVMLTFSIINFVSTTDANPDKLCFVRKRQ